MRDVISEFNSGRMGSHVLFVRVVSLCAILCLICSGKSLHVLCILPLGMLSLSACRMMFVKVVFAVCVFVGGAVFAKADSVCLVNCAQSAFL